MADIEMVKKALESCAAYNCEECPYDGCVGIACMHRLAKEALKLLKEKDPLPAEMEGGGSSWWYVCGDCHGAINLNDHYCRHCGRGVTWT